MKILILQEQPGAYMTYLNSLLCPLLPSGQFATMFYGVIDFKNNNLAYTSAAAPYPIIFRHNSQLCKVLDKGSPAAWGQRRQNIQYAPKSLLRKVICCFYIVMR